MRCSNAFTLNIENAERRHNIIVNVRNARKKFQLL